MEKLSVDSGQPEIGNGDRKQVGGNDTSYYLPILNYHTVISSPDEYECRDEERPYVLDLSVFRKYLDFINQSGFTTLSEEDLGRWVRGESDFFKPFVVTFDDGHLSQYQYAADYLEERGMTAVFFVTAGWVGKKDLMDWQHLRDLASRGFGVGSHGFSHVPLTRLAYRELVVELGKSKEVLQDRLGIQIQSFSVPRGFYHPGIRQIAGEMGYRFIFTSNFDINSKTLIGHARPFQFNRMVIKSNTTFDEFCRLIQGRLGVKKYVESMKSLARQWLAPAVYDGVSKVKRGEAVRKL